MRGKIKSLGILIFVIFLFTISCKKDEKKVTFSGTIVDFYTDTPISGAQITLASKKIESGVYNSNFQDITTIISDGNGQFSIDSKYEAVVAYRIYVKKDKYFDNSTEINSNSVSEGTNYNANYSIAPEAYIKLHIKNITPYDSLDVISYSYKNLQPGCIDCCNNTVFQGVGKFFETTIKCKTFGNKNNKVEWNVTKNGFTILHSQDVFCTPLDTTNFEILY
jgi:hypothetical protein